MALPQRRLATYEDLLALPEGERGEVLAVVSPSTAARDRVTKRQLYARCGVPYYWLIDPDARVLEALALRDGVWVELGVYDDSATARIEPFHAVELAVGRLFLPREADGD